MLSRVAIKTRFVGLAAVLGVAILGLGAIAVSSLRSADTALDELHRLALEHVALAEMGATVRDELLGVSSDPAAIHAARNLFVSQWNEFQRDMTPREIDSLRNTLARQYTSVLLAFTDAEQGVGGAEMRQQLDRRVRPFLTQLDNRIADVQLQSELANRAADRINIWFVIGTIAAVLLVAVASTVLTWRVYLTLRQPMDRIVNTINAATGGDALARTKLTSRDEFGAVGSAVDRLLDARLATLLRVEDENAGLHESVLALSQAVFKLSQRDLTVMIPVTDDATGPVADALNRLIGEMTSVLVGVRNIADQVAKASTMVRTQSDVVIAAAAQEHREIEQTATALDQTARTLHHLSEVTGTCTAAAEQAAQNTLTALQTVTATVAGMNEIHNTLGDAEQRITHLAGLARDLGQFVSTFDALAERMHILALNASMVANGDARNEPVAAELQQLADAARAATGPISATIGDIQIDTVNMLQQTAHAIARVVEGSRRAAEAGEHMLQTRTSTDRLVEAVQLIVRDAEEQARLGEKLRGHAQSIQNSARKTRAQLEEQTQYTKRLSQFSKGLVAAVQVFKLSPASHVAGEPVVPVVAEPEVMLQSKAG